MICQDNIIGYSRHSLSDSLFFSDTLFTAQNYLAKEKFALIFEGNLINVEKLSFRDNLGFYLLIIIILCKEEKTSQIRWTLPLWYNFEAPKIVSARKCLLYNKLMKLEPLLVRASKRISVSLYSALLVIFRMSALSCLDWLI